MTVYYRDQFRTNILQGQVPKPSHIRFPLAAAFLDAHPPRMSAVLSPGALEAQPGLHHQSTLLCSILCPWNGKVPRTPDRET